MEKDTLNRGSQELKRGKLFSIFNSYILNPINRRKKGFSIILFSAALLFLFIGGCDLFNGVSTENLLKKIDDDIAFSNAAQLSVNLVVPPGWGTSTREGTIADVREGYPFEVDFTPTEEFALLEWRVFKTADLPEGWELQPYKIIGNPEPGQVIKINDISEVVKPTDVSENGGKVTITINTKEPVTLVPWSRKQPRLLYSLPSIKTRYYPRTSNIALTFASNLNPATIKFEENYFQITARALDEDGKFTGDPAIPLTLKPNRLIESGEHFYSFISNTSDSPDTSNYNDITRTLTFRANVVTGGIILGVPQNHDVILTIGTSVETVSGAKRVEPLVMNWQTRKNDCRIIDWRAWYDGTHIRLNWNIAGGATPKVFYHLTGNSTQARGTATALTGLNSSSTGCSIPAAELTTTQLDSITSETTLKTLVSRIWIDLDDNGEENIPMDEDNPIQIWTVPGMEVGNSKPAKIITNLSELSAISTTVSDPDQSYILVNNISIAGDWTPLGNSLSSFKGKFSGMRKTITFPAGTTIRDNGSFIGLFGHTSGNASIQNLTVRYSNVIDLTTNNFGGVAGYAESTTLRDVTARYSAATMKLTSTSSGEVFYGGIVGNAGFNVTMIDTTARNDAAVTWTSSSSSNAFFGGVAGRAAAVSMEGVTATFGNTTAPSWSKTTSNQNNAYFGGITGYADNVSLKDINLTYSAGSTWNSSANSYFGGISGVSNYTNMKKITLEYGALSWNSNTSPSFGGVTGSALGATLEDIDVTYSGNSTWTTQAVVTYYGGIVGNASGSVLKKIGVKYSATASWSTGSTSTANHFGGVGLATSSTIDDVSIEYNQTMTWSSNSTSAYFGGLTGYADNATISNCEVKGSGALSVNNIYGSGGLVGYANGATKIEDSTASVNITYTRNDSNIGRIGGIVGYANGSSLANMVTIVRSSYENGKISVTGTGTSGTGTVYTGGVVGYVNNFFSADNSYSKTTNSIQVNRTGTCLSYTGGFVGYVNGPSVEIRNCNSESPVILGPGVGTGLYHAYTGGFAGMLGAGTINNNYSKGEVESISRSSLFTGGFAGYTSAAIDRCYATGNVKAENYGVPGQGSAVYDDLGAFVRYNSPAELDEGKLEAGGLVGRATGAITRSWAGGIVTATRSASNGSSIYAGGLVGYLNGSNSSIQNSYAIGGDVGSDEGVFITCAYSTYSNSNMALTVNLAAGGLAGRAYYGIVENSFAKKGLVKINSSASAAAYAGGLLGYATNGTVRNNVSLGDKVITTTSGSTRFANRAAGSVASATYQNIYARSNMLIGTGAYNASITPDFASAIGLTNVNGQDTFVRTLKNITFWTTAGTGNMGFDSAIWTNGNVGNTGHPRLSNVGTTGDQSSSEKNLETPGNTITTKGLLANGSTGPTGSVTVDTDKAEPREIVYITLTPPPGYNFTTAQPTVTPAATVTGAGNTRQFQMPDSDVTVTYSFEAQNQKIIGLGVSGSGTSTYTVSRGSTDFFTVNNANPQSTLDPLTPVNPALPRTDDTITITAAPDNAGGFSVGSIKAKTSSGDDVVTIGTGNSRTFVMPASAVTVEVIFEEVQITLSTTGGSVATGGTWVVKDPFGNTVANNGKMSLQTYTIEATVANVGWTVKSMTATGVDTVEFTLAEGMDRIGRFTLDNPNIATVIVAVTFEQRKFDAGPASGGSTTTGGTFTVSPTTGLNYDGTVTITATPNRTKNDKDYTHAPGTPTFAPLQPTSGPTEWVENTSNKTFRSTFTMPASNVTVGVPFGLYNNSITRVTPTNGTSVVTNSITSTTNVTSGDAGTDYFIRVIPNANYRVKTVSVYETITEDVVDFDEKGFTAPYYNYSFEMPPAAVTVEVTFENAPPITFTASPTGGSVTVTADGSSVSTGDTVAAGELVVVKLTPETGYMVSGIPAITGNPSSDIVDGVYTYSFDMPTGAVTITVAFAKIQHDLELTVKDLEGGSISATVNSLPSGKAGIDDVVVVTAEPLLPGWQVKSWKTVPSSLPAQSGGGTGTKLEFEMPNDDVSVEVEFEKIPYNINSDDTENGSFSVWNAATGGTVAAKGTMGTKYYIRTVPKDSTYEVDSVKVNGGIILTIIDDAYEFTMPAGDVAVTVTFKLIE